MKTKQQLSFLPGCCILAENSLDHQGEVCRHLWVQFNGNGVRSDGADVGDRDRPLIDFQTRLRLDDLDDLYVGHAPEDGRLRGGGGREGIEAASGESGSIPKPAAGSARLAFREEKELRGN